MQDLQGAMENLESCVQFHTQPDVEDVEVLMRAFKTNFELLKIYRTLSDMYKEDTKVMAEPLTERELRVLRMDFGAKK